MLINMSLVKMISVVQFFSKKSYIPWHILFKIHSTPSRLNLYLPSLLPTSQQGVKYHKILTLYIQECWVENIVKACPGERE